MKNSARISISLASLTLLAGWGTAHEAQATYTRAYPPEDRQENPFIPYWKRREEPSVNDGQPEARYPAEKTVPSGITAQPLGMNRPDASSPTSAARNPEPWSL